MSTPDNSMTDLVELTPESLVHAAVILEREQWARCAPGARSVKRGKRNDPDRKRDTDLWSAIPGQLSLFDDPNGESDSA